MPVTIILLAALVVTSESSERTNLARCHQLYERLVTGAADAFVSFSSSETVTVEITTAGAGLLAAADELAGETGAPVAEVRAGIEEMNATLPTMLRRFLLVAGAK